MLLCIKSTHTMPQKLRWAYGGTILLLLFFFSWVRLKTPEMMERPDLPAEMEAWTCYTKQLECVYVYEIRRAGGA